LRPDLSIVDGSVGQDGEGPLYGRAAHLGVIVAGRDSLAVDLVCCQLVRVDPLAIGHLRLGLQQLGHRQPYLSGDVVEPGPAFTLPSLPSYYRFAFWLMYPLNYPFHRLTGSHLCTTLYRTGAIGTRPRILQDAYTRCGACVVACPL